MATDQDPVVAGGKCPFERTGTSAVRVVGSRGGLKARCFIFFSRVTCHVRFMWAKWADPHNHAGFRAVRVGQSVGHRVGHSDALVGQYLRLIKEILLF